MRYLESSFVKFPHRCREGLKGHIMCNYIGNRDICNPQLDEAKAL